MHSTITNQALRRFSTNERGTIAVMFALLLVPVLGIIFGGIDYSRAMSVRSQLQTAADAAANSAIRRLAEGTSTAEEAFRIAFQENLPDDLKDQAYDLRFSGDGKRLSVDLSTSVPTTMVALMGLSKLDVAVAATAKVPEPELYSRSKGGTALDALPDTVEGQRARADLERSIRSAGFSPPKAPEKYEIEEARRQFEDALRSAGMSANLPRNAELPDPAELERMQQQIMRELSRLRF